MNNQIISLEPPDGDFAAYIDAIVGPPPEDPETAAREISEQLALRSEDNIEIMNAISLTRMLPSESGNGEATIVPRGPLSTGSGTLAQHAQQALSVGSNGQVNQLPDLAAALQSAAQRGQSGIRKLIRSFSSLMIIGGVIWTGLTLAFEREFGGLSPAPGIMAIFIGIILNNASAKKTRKA